MKSVSKKLYLLIVIAVLSFCAVLFPMSANTAKAEVSFNLQVEKAQIKAQLIADADGNNEWAVMFKATIARAELEAAGDTEVKFGMLVGPASKAEGNESYQDYVDDTFKSFENLVNSKDIKLTEEQTGFDYYAGVKFNDANPNFASDANKLAAGKVKLMAVPFYEIDGVKVLGKGGAVESRKLLTESYALKSDADEQVKIPVEKVNAYAGQYSEEEAYICKSTDRLMTTAVEGGDLTARTFDEKDEIFIGKDKKASADVENLVKEDLAVNGATQLIAFTHDGKAIYMNAKHAERVITRFWKEDSESTLEDYYAYKAEKDYRSIWYLSSNTEIPGLYVLANDITANVKGGDYKTKSSAGTDYKGLTGTFDGRGKVFDMGASVKQLTGFFPGLTNATVKNVALINGAVMGAGGAYGEVLIAYFARNTIFEDVFVNYRAVSNFGASYTRYLFINKATDCEFRNVIVDCNHFVTQSDYNTLKAGYAYQYRAKGTDNVKGTEDDIYFGFKTSTDEQGVYTAEFVSLNKAASSSCQDNSLSKVYKANGLIGQNAYFLPNMTASNFFAVGSTPLFIFNQASHANIAAAKFNLEVNLYLNEMPKYNAGTAEEPDFQTVPEFIYDENGTASYAYFSEDQFVGSGYEEMVKPYYEMAYLHLLCKFGELVNAKIAAGDKVKISFRVKTGAYNMNTADEFSAWIKNDANAEKLAKFNSKYWAVDTKNGTVTWKGLSA